MRKEIENSPKHYCSIANCVPPIRRRFPYLSNQIGLITANTVTVCALMHEILALETPKFSIRLWNVFWINIRKNIENSPKRFCVHVIFLTSPRPLFFLLLLTASFWTEFWEHVFTLNLASIVLNMHTFLCSLESSMQQIF